MYDLTLVSDWLTPKKQGLEVAVAVVANKTAFQLKLTWSLSERITRRSECCRQCLFVFVFFCSCDHFPNPW
jgi:hypothetical protein